MSYRIGETTISIDGLSVMVNVVWGQQIAEAVLMDYRRKDLPQGAFGLPFTSIWVAWQEDDERKGHLLATVADMLTAIRIEVTRQDVAYWQGGLTEHEGKEFLALHGEEISKLVRDAAENIIRNFN